MSIKIDDNVIREFRNDKISHEIANSMNALLKECYNEEEFLDLISIYLQSIGAAIVTLEGADDDEIESFIDFVLANLKTGFVARRNWDNGKEI